MPQIRYPLKQEAIDRIIPVFEALLKVYRALSDNLKNLHLPRGSALLQYVDNLLVCSPSEEACKIDTVVLLKHLADNGHKVSQQNFNL